MTGAEREELTGMIRERFRAGDTVEQIAGEFGVAEADVERICAWPRGEDRKQWERLILDRFLDGKPEARTILVLRHACAESFVHETHRRYAEIARRIQAGQNKVTLAEESGLAWEDVARIGRKVANRGKTEREQLAGMVRSHLGEGKPVAQIIEEFGEFGFFGFTGADVQRACIKELKAEITRRILSGEKEEALAGKYGLARADIRRILTGGGERGEGQTP